MKTNLLVILRNLTIALACFLGMALPASAQILYTAFNGSTFQLRQVNSDGSGDSPVATPFANLAFPAWSRDRALIALSATDPDRPTQHTLNVYIFDPANGARQNVTNNQDAVNGSSSNYVSSYHKAFSPDRQSLAINSVYSATNSNGSSNTPILQIYAANGQSGSLAIVHAGPIRDNLHHDGEGVSWSPTQNLLAYPVKTDTRLQSGNGVGETTAISLGEPVTGAGNSRQLTTPHADQVATPTDGYVYGEHDYQPKFSPNGALVAYVRSFQIARYANGYVPDPDQQSLHIININTGADTTVLNLSQGYYVTTLDWSPDGSALVFDASPQYVDSSGARYQLAQPGSDQVYIVNVDGSGLRQLRGAGSGMPAWAPAVVLQPGSLGNISTRLVAGTGDNALIGGFIITGTQPKKVIIRAIGPSLSLPGKLADPTLELRDGSGTLLEANDNWGDSPNKQAIIDSGVPPTNNLESAIVRTLPANNAGYTAILRGANNGTGVGVVEAYDLDRTADSRLANISTRGLVQTGDNVLFAGTIVVGQTSQKVIIRAIGPSLSVPGKLADPMLELRDSNGAVVESNDNWVDSPNKQAIIDSGVPPTNNLESAIVRTLSANNATYTAIVRGVNNSTGIAVVEVYAIH